MTLAKQLQNKHTYTEYLSWPDEERWELIDGAAYNMTPAPSFRHQMIVGAFHQQLANKLAGKTCVAVVAPADVVLSECDVVQPDVFVVCDRMKIKEANVQGAPDLIVEVLSPSTALKDQREKKTLYEKYGVKEYIIADPLQNYVERFVLKDGKFSAPEIFGPQDSLPLYSLEGLEIQLSDIFGGLT